MKRVCLILLLFLPAIVSATSFSQYESLTVQMQTSDKIDVRFLGVDSRLDSLTAELLFFPKDTPSTNVLSMKSPTNFTENSTALVFSFMNVMEQQIIFGTDARVDMKYWYPKVTKKVEFPILRVPEDLREYTMPQDKIDSNDTSIMDMASSIAEGSDDLYDVVFRLADWVESHVTYNLTTATASASQRASWVLTNRYGVCDEITTLFVAMVRCLGIPARYVSGLAYTDFEGLEDFGPHAWAEVYFPEFGWVPFDLTYGQYGMLDTTHIPLSYSKDAGESSVRFTWMSFQTDIKTMPLEFNVDVVRTGNKLMPSVDLQLIPWKSEVGFGSYTLVEGVVKNPNDAYLPLIVKLASSRGSTLLSQEKHQILLKPKEERRIYWVLKVDPELDRGYVYTFNNEMYTSLNETAFASFVAKEESPFYLRDDVESVVSQQEEERVKVYSRKVEFNCSPEQSEYYGGESPKASCKARNVGTTKLEDTVVCLDSCKPLPLNIGQERVVTFDLDASVGVKDVQLLLNSSKASKAVGVKYTVWDDPKIAIENITLPMRLSFGQEFELQFMLSKKSLQRPRDVQLSIEQAGFKKEWTMAELSEDRLFVVSLDGALLNKGENPIKIIVQYTDGRGKPFDGKVSKSVLLDKVTFSQQIIIWLNALGRGFATFDLRFIIPAGLLIGIVFGALIQFTMKPESRIERDIDKLRKNDNVPESGIEKKL